MRYRSSCYTHPLSRETWRQGSSNTGCGYFCIHLTTFPHSKYNVSNENKCSVCFIFKTDSGEHWPLVISQNLFYCTVTRRGRSTCILVPQRGQPLQFSLSQSLLKDSSTAFWITLFPKRCSMNFFPSVVADRYSSLRLRNSSVAQDKEKEWHWF